MAIVSVFCVGVMLATGIRWTKPPAPPGDEDPLSGLAESPAAVATRKLEPGRHEVLISYAGMIRPFRRYTLSLEEGGRLTGLGESPNGDALDEGDRVAPDQLLAEVDREALEARRLEVSARIEQAEALHTQAVAEKARAQRLRERSSTALSEEEWLQRVTAVQQREAEISAAKAQLAMVDKSLANTRLVAPVEGVISRRFVNPGETVNPRQAVFEVVEVNRLLLVLGVPESRIRPILGRFAAVRGGGASPADAQKFAAHVRLLGTDLLGRRNPSLEAEVYRISETADDRTGLFEVEVLIPNADRGLRPGMVAEADLVVEQLEGYRIPSTAVLFRAGRARLFFAVAGKAKMVELTHWIEQGGELLVPAENAGTEAAGAATNAVRTMPAECDTLIVRGQHRLVEGRPLEVVSGPGSEAPEQAPTVYVSEARN